MEQCLAEAQVYVMLCLLTPPPVVSVVVPLLPGYKYGRQAGPLAGGVDRRHQGHGQRQPKAPNAEN